MQTVQIITSNKIHHVFLNLFLGITILKSVPTKFVLK